MATYFIPSRARARQTRELPKIRIGHRAYAALSARLAVLESRRAGRGLALSRGEGDELALLQRLAAAPARPQGGAPRKVMHASAK